MNSALIDLYKARDAIDSFAISVRGDPGGTWRARSGFGSDFAKEWSVEFQSRDSVDLDLVAWSAVLDRVIEAHQLSDPLIADYKWPLVETVEP